MPNPRRKFSKQRKRLRQGQQNLTPVHTVPCSQCMEPRRSHRVCPKCGHYRGETVLTVKKD